MPQSHIAIAIIRRKFRCRFLIFCSIKMLLHTLQCITGTEKQIAEIMKGKMWAAIREA